MLNIMDVKENWRELCISFWMRKQDHANSRITQKSDKKKTSPKV